MELITPKLLTWLAFVKEIMHMVSMNIQIEEKETIMMILQTMDVSL